MAARSRATASGSRGDSGLRDAINAVVGALPLASLARRLASVEAAVSRLEREARGVLGGGRAKRSTAKRAPAKRTTAKLATAKPTTAKRTTAKRVTAKAATARRDELAAQRDQLIAELSRPIEPVPPVPDDDVLASEELSVAATAFEAPGPLP